MKFPGLARALVVLALLAAGMLSSVPAAARVLGDLQFEPCVLTAAGLPRPTEAHCATITVSENPAAPDEGQIELALAWIPVEGDAEPDPVVFIAGGPGQSAREAYPAIAPAFNDIRRTRHILLLDQRGTGGSRPLFCPDEEEAALAPAEATPEQLRAHAERCRDELEQIADLRFYTTGEAVHDLELMRRRVGAAQLNLVGVSYGTRVAQQYAKTHPERVRTLLLDSVVPMDLALGAEHARNLEDALAAQFARCRATPACLEAFGDPEARLARAAARLRTGDLPAVRYRDPTSGEWREETPSHAHLAAVIRLYSYMPLTASLLPLIVHQADEGDFVALLAMMRMMLRDIGGQMASGMHNSVICTEDADEIEIEPQPGTGDTLLGDDFVAGLQAQCAIWPRGTRPDDFRLPLRGDIPALLVSGEYDPVTPPRYGDRVAAELRHARHVVLRGQGHSLLATGCMPTLAAQFIEDANALALDASCLERIAPPPPFSGLHGWEP